MELLCRRILLFWCFLHYGASGVDPDRVSVMEEDSVTLNTDVQTYLQDRIRWYFNDTLIAQINGDLSKTCTDVQCNEDNERFRDRLKLDHHTGSLTIMNITNTHSGVYELKISSGSRDHEKTFIVSLNERDEVKRKSVKEGESLTLDSGVIKHPNDLKTWYFNEILIAEITGDQSKICTDVQCEERFRDRLKLDHQNGSLTIMNIRTTDSGEYKLKISRSSINIIRSFSVNVTAVPGSGLSSAAAAGISVSVLLFVAVAVAAVIYYYHRQKENGNQCRDQGRDVPEAVALNPTENPQRDVGGDG